MRKGNRVDIAENTLPSVPFENYRVGSSSIFEDRLYISIYVGSREGIEYYDNLRKCPKCRSGRHEFVGNVKKSIVDIPHKKMKVFWEVVLTKYRCTECSRYFRQYPVQSEGMGELDPKKRYTERLRRWIVKEDKSYNDISKLCGLSRSLIANIKNPSY